MEIQKTSATNRGAAVPSLSEVLALARALGALKVPQIGCTQELSNCDPLPADPDTVLQLKRDIASGGDPLGEWYSSLLPPMAQKRLGSVYTPSHIIDYMLDRLPSNLAPTRVVDVGAGTGRFLLRAAVRFPSACLLASEIDPIAATLARANLAAAGLTSRAQVVQGDYRELRLEPSIGPTLFIGNPPYVRHHQISREWKEWYVKAADTIGYQASTLAGLHAHFYLATALAVRPNDFGTFITSSEWLSTNYGSTIRQLLIKSLGVSYLDILDPRFLPFQGKRTTAIISGFSVGSVPESTEVRSVSSFQELSSQRPESHRVAVHTLATSSNWPKVIKGHSQADGETIPLGDICSVHRGQATGMNKLWVTTMNEFHLPPDVLFPAVTRARELFAVDGMLGSTTNLRSVISLPEDLGELDIQHHGNIQQFLRHAESLGANDGYLARNRKSWWSIRLMPPAPILVTYMARRKPAFVVNAAQARHINIAHGIYPRIHLSVAQISNLARYLQVSVSQVDGRTYAGGLVKYEPREIERLRVPEPEYLEMDLQHITSRSDWPVSSRGFQ